MELRVHELIRPSVRRADGGLAVAIRIPGDAHARADVAPLRQHARLARESRVAGEKETGGCLREDRAADVLAEPRLIELIDRAVQQLLREERLPADAEVQ